MTEPDLNELLAPKAMQPGSRLLIPPDVAKARRAEKRKRINIATGLAITALRRLHSDDYRALLRQAKAAVAAERGPLPGDET